MKSTAYSIYDLPWASLASKVEIFILIRPPRVSLESADFPNNSQVAFPAETGQSISLASLKPDILFCGIGKLLPRNSLLAIFHVPFFLPQVWSLFVSNSFASFCFWKMHVKTNCVKVSFYLLTVASYSNESFSFKWESPILHPSSHCCTSFLVEGKRQAGSSLWMKNSHLNRKLQYI